MLLRFSSHREPGTKGQAQGHRHCPRPALSQGPRLEPRRPGPRQHPHGPPLDHQPHRHTGHGRTALLGEAHAGSYLHVHSCPRTAAVRSLTWSSAQGPCSQPSLSLPGPSGHRAPPPVSPTQPPSAIASPAPAPWAPTTPPAQARRTQGAGKEGPTLPREAPVQGHSRSLWMSPASSRWAGQASLSCLCGRIRNVQL